MNSDPAAAHFYACLLLTAIILAPIASGIWYGILRANENNYIQTECMIKNYTIQSKIFNSGAINQALGQTYSRYIIWWTYLYNTTDSTSIEISIESARSTETYDEAKKVADQRPINSTSTCYYDKRDVNKVQWEKPSSKTAFIFMLCAIGLFVATCIIIPVVWLLRN